MVQTPGYHSSLSMGAHPPEWQGNPTADAQSVVRTTLPPAVFLWRGPRNLMLEAGVQFPKNLFRVRHEGGDPKLVPCTRSRDRYLGWTRDLLEADAIIVGVGRSRNFYI
jgi:hypothetical protein